MATSGQTLNDRINAARYALAGQGLARCVCKATTEEVIGPKKKHLDYLLACTHEPNVSIPQLANLLIERTNHIHWVVVFKALVTVHHLMSYGNERFIQYLASSNYSFELSTFLDKTSGRDFSMSTFIRRYSRYINEKAISYRMSAFDFCKIKRGNEGVLRLMPIDRLLKTLPILQNQLDALLDFDCSASDLNNGVINACFMLLFRDLIGLFACHNDGIINLLNKYFSLNKKMCREALDLYKKFLVRMDKVSEFLRVAEVVGIDKDEIPDLRRAPSSLIDALEQHLQNLESNKKMLKSSSGSNSKTNEMTTTGAGFGSSEAGFVISSSSPSSVGQASKSSSSSANNNNNNSSTTNDDLALGASFKDDEVRKALEEEARVLSLYGSGEAKKSSSRSSPGQLRTNASSDSDSLKFAVTTTPKTIDDIFGDPNSFGSNNINTTSDRTMTKTNGLESVTAFDSVASATSATDEAKQHSARPGSVSIRTAIQSATTTLEKANTSGTDGKAGGASKKASDDLFSLLDTPASTTTANPLASTKPAVSEIQTTTSLLDSSSQQTNPISPFANSSPFDLPTNGQTNQPLNTASMKPGNPFPGVAVGGNSFSAAFSSDSTLTAQPALNSAFKQPGARQQTGANYTNLGGLEGFGDVLQPTFAAGSNQSHGHGGVSAKPSFTSSSGLSSTGLFKGDLDSTLANLAQNLTFEGFSKPKK
jgi:hypothetical protein